jgi:hypothetical protein
MHQNAHELKHRKKDLREKRHGKEKLEDIW